MHLSRLWALPSCGLLVVALSGCGDTAKVSHPDVSPASGTVTYNGNPVGGATVVFTSSESTTKGWGCSAVTDAQGKFEMMTIFVAGSSVKGVVPGDYDVTVTKKEAPKPLSDAEEAKKAAEIIEAKGRGTYKEEPPVIKSLVPEKYGAAATSELKVKVEKAGNKNIELKLAD